MQFGKIGLGNMGASTVYRRIRAGRCGFVYDRNPALMKALAVEGAVAVVSLADLRKNLSPLRAACLTLPAAATAATDESVGDPAARLAGCGRSRVFAMRQGCQRV